MTAQSDSFAQSSAVASPVAADADGAAMISPDQSGAERQPNGQSSIWLMTPGLDQRLIELCSEDRSFSNIASKLSEEFSVPISRGAAIGRANRLELPARAKYQTAAGIVRPTGKKHRKRVPAKAPAKPAPPPPDLSPKPLVELGRRDCRFPTIGTLPPYLFCAQPTIEHSSWCPEHFRIVYTPVRAR